MGKVLDITLRREDVERYVGALVLQLFDQRRQIEVLEARVDELDGPDETGPDYAPPPVPAPEPEKRERHA